MDTRATKLTGMTGNSRDSSSKYYSKKKSRIDKEDSITITYINLNSDGTEGDEYTNTYYHYHTENGQKASTTRNIYGVYDMSGGAWEYTASYLEEGTTTNVSYFNNQVEDKYKMKYKGTGATSSLEDRKANWEANKQIWGDALYETSIGVAGNYSWNNDYSSFPYLAYPFLLRGARFDSGADTGLFCFGNGMGGSSSGMTDGFRMTAV